MSLQTMRSIPLHKCTSISHTHFSFIQMFSFSLTFKKNVFSQRDYLKTVRLSTWDVLNLFLTVESQFHFISLSFHFMEIDVQWNDWKMKIIKFLWLLFSFCECFFFCVIFLDEAGEFTTMNLIAFIYFPLFHSVIFLLNFKWS